MNDMKVARGREGKARLRRRVTIGTGDLTASQRATLAAIADFSARRGATAYLVGGFLRDRLLGRDTDDLDVVVEGVAPDAVARHLSHMAGFSRPVVFPRFRTVLMVGRGLRIEICRLRSDLAADASRRDFTVNALYADLRGFKGGRALRVLDPMGCGLDDIASMTLRTPGDPHFILWLDPLRMVRAVRFTATGRFRLDHGLARAIPAMAYLITRVSAERVRVELEKILVSGRLDSALRLLQKTGLLDLIAPELGRTYGYDQGTPYHAFDLFTHLVKTAARMPPEVPLRLAGLLHDLGKTSTASARPDRMVYYGHEEVSAREAAAIMRRLKFSNRSVELVTFLVGHHMVNYSEAWGDKAVRRLARKMGSRLDPLLTLAEADRRSQRPGPAGRRGAAALRARISRLRDSDRLESPVPVDGREIMAILGIGQGPLVGEAKDRLAEECLRRGRPMTRAEAEAVLEAWYRGRGAGPHPAGRAPGIGVDNVRRA
jgi:poly(A) polymerase